MTQNIYDRPNFFAGYSALPRSREGLAGAAEWPALRALLPELEGRDIVDLGCGFGWFCRHARREGAARVLGLDVSEKMLARARAETRDEAIAYRRADLEELALPESAFDLAFSSLAFHYVERFPALLATVHQALRPEGRLVFSMEHPVFTAPVPQGWAEGEGGRAVWPLHGYLDEGRRVTDWLAPGVVKQHRTLGTVINALVAAGFAIRHVEEWGPDEAQIRAHPEWAMERERPMFLLAAATRATAPR